MPLGIVESLIEQGAIKVPWPSLRPVNLGWLLGPTPKPRIQHSDPKIHPIHHMMMLDWMEDGEIDFFE